MLQIDGRREPGALTKTWSHLRFGLRLGLPVAVEVHGDGPGCRFVCSSRREFKRATNLYSKEPGTIAWLERELQPGDAFLDIGANIGIYTIYAARLLGDGGQVAAVEPHVVNAGRLLDNVEANGLGDRVRVLTCALADTSGFEDFHYRDQAAGSSNSQLAAALDSHGRAFQPAAVELKAVTTVDELVAGRIINRPDLVKIDVDGIEPRVLDGMRETLTAPTRPRSIQVEVGPQTLESIESRLDEWGYRRQDRHFSRARERELAAGTPEHALSHNVIYTPA